MTAVISAFLLMLTSAASAHVVVQPAEVPAASFQTFTAGAPNEKDIPFNEIKLLIPEGLGHVSVTQKPGWQVNVETEGEGSETAVKSITWHGGNVPAGFREDFTFSAQAPAETTELRWKAYQTYANGETVAWDLTNDEQPKTADGAPDFSQSGPFSVTKVVAETELAASLKKAEQAASDAKKSANRALYVGAAGIVIGLTGIALATRKK